ncbi:MAG TPA: MFS transporter [Acidobacteriaceae bacterium]
MNLETSGILKTAATLPESLSGEPEILLVRTPDQDLQDEADRLRAVKKARLRIGPFVALMFAISILDRSNVSFAREALRTTEHIGDAAFALGAGIFFIGYGVFEVPSNLLLQRVGAKVWLSRIMVTWGIASALMMFVHGNLSFYLLRFLVGLAEAGFSPGVVLYCTYWFPANERGKALGMYYMGLPASLTFGSALSGWLMQVMDGRGGLHNWQWMFLIEGLAASVVGVIAFFYLTSKPRDAKWLTEGERNALEKNLAHEEQQRHASSPRDSLAALRDPRLLWFVAIYFTIQVGMYGVIFYLPSRIAELSGAAMNSRVGLMVAIPWLCALVCLRVITGLADRLDRHRHFAMAMLCLGALGLACSMRTTHVSLSVMAFCLAASGFVVVQPLFWTLPTGYLRGAAAATGIAVIGALGNLGGFVAPTLKTFAEKQFQNQSAGMLTLACIAVAGLLLLATQRTTSRASQGTT